MSKEQRRKELEKEFAELRQEWSVIYRWDKCANLSDAEPIAEILLERFDKIDLDRTGLRHTKSFKTDDHDGQAALQSDIDQVTEKRLCRAMFNARTIDGLGKVLDYETPLDEGENSGHGDIDLLCLRDDDTLLIVEAKSPTEGDSLFKAILQTFVYTRLVASVKEKFLSDFDLPSNLKLRPAILTFEGADSRRPLKQPEEYPSLRKLCNDLNESLAKEKIEPFEFHVLPAKPKGGGDWESCLTTEPFHGAEKLIRFKPGISLTTDRVTFPEAG